MVIVSVPAFVVIVTFAPATNVRVSAAASATTSDCPDTTIVLNRFWSPVLVPDEVPLKVPDCVASVPNPKVVLTAEASASSNIVCTKSVIGISSMSPAEALTRPNNLSVADTFCILAYVTASLAIVAANEPIPEPVTSPVKVIVWSPVLVPEEVPLNVPDWVAKVPNPNVVLASEEVASSNKLLA